MRPSSPRQNAPTTLRDLCALGKEWLAKKGIENPRLDAELLIGKALNMTRLELYLDLERPVSEQEKRACRELLVRRSTHEPVAYILGTRGFYGRDFQVDKSVLIPRPDTESVVEKALESIAHISQPKVMDLGTGSGCIAITIALENPGAKVSATDLSDKAIAIAEKNAETLGAEITFVQSDWFKNIDDDLRFDLIISNPPYVKKESELMPDVRDHEPAMALFGEGDEAIGHYKTIMADAARYCSDVGVIVFEIGFDQARAIQSIDAEGFLPVEIFKDLAHNDRIAVFRRRP